MGGKKTSDISIYRKFDIQYFDTSKFRYTIFRYIETWIRYPTLLKIVAVDHSCKIADYVARAPRERYGVCPSCYLFVDIYRGEKKLNKGVGKGVLPYLHLRVLVHTFLLLPVYLSVYLVELWREIFQARESGKGYSCTFILEYDVPFFRC